MNTRMLSPLRRWPGKPSHSHANGLAGRVALRSRHNAGVNLFLSPERITSPESLRPLASSAQDAQASQLQSLVARIAQAAVSRSAAEQALAQLYDATVQRVYALVRRFVPDEAAAQDVTQEVYLQAWAQAERFDAQRGAVMAWLLNLARSRALDAWRKQSASPVLADSDVADNAVAHWASPTQPLDLIDAMDTRCALHAALAQLPALTRQMLSLAFFQDMSHQQISEHLRMPLGTVKSTVRRALLALRDHLQQLGLGPEHLASLSVEALEDIA
jgi:RNA polymerase sigma factor (sigma-70 family)